MKNEIKNKLIKNLINNISIVLCITTNERKNELVKLVDNDGDYVLLFESSKSGLISLDEISSITNIVNSYPCVIKTIIIEYVDSIYTDTELDCNVYKMEKYKYITEELSKISIQNDIKIILFDNNTKTAFSHGCDFHCNISDNDNFQCLKNRDGSDFVEGSDYIEYITKNLSNLNYITFK